MKKTLTTPKTCPCTPAGTLGTMSVSSGRVERLFLSLKLLWWSFCSVFHIQGHKVSQRQNLNKPPSYIKSYQPLHGILRKRVFWYVNCTLTAMTFVGTTCDTKEEQIKWKENHRPKHGSVVPKQYKTFHSSTFVSNLVKLSRNYIVTWGTSCPDNCICMC